MLRMEGRKVVVVGGGSVARRRIEGLLKCGAKVTVIAPKTCPEIEQLGVTIERRAYQPGDLEGAKVVVIATDDAAVNTTVQRAAQALGILVNRTDDPDSGDLSVMAHARRGPVTLGVATDGISARAASTIRDELLERLNEAWVEFLQAAEPLRREIQDRENDATRRREKLTRMADSRALEIFNREGAQGLRSWVWAEEK